MGRDVNEGLAVTTLREQDLEQCLMLSTETGWNQTISDWEFHLHVGKGIGLRLDSGDLVATGVVLPTGRDVGWVAMILVSEPHRRRGYGRRVMEHLIDQAEFGCLALDATELGKGLYESLGFQSLENITRYRARRGDVPAPKNDIKRTAGGRRLPFQGIARALADRSDVSVVWEGTACALVRPGRLANHVGPLAAGSEVDAAALIASILDRTDGDLIIDAPDRNGTFTRRLERIGLTAERAFVRMARGGSFYVDPGYFAIAGPEYG